MSVQQPVVVDTYYADLYLGDTTGTVGTPNNALGMPDDVFTTNVSGTWGGEWRIEESADLSATLTATVGVVVATPTTNIDPVFEFTLNNTSDERPLTLTRRSDSYIEVRPTMVDQSWRDTNFRRKQTVACFALPNTNRRFLAVTSGYAYTQGYIEQVSVDEAGRPTTVPYTINKTAGLTANLPSDISDADLSSNGRYLVVVAAARFDPYGADRILQIYDLNHASKVATLVTDLSLHTDIVSHFRDNSGAAWAEGFSAVSFSPDYRWVALGGTNDDGLCILIVDFKAGSLGNKRLYPTNDIAGVIQSIPRLGEACSTLRWSPDGKYIAAAIGTRTGTLDNSSRYAGSPWLRVYKWDATAEQANMMEWEKDRRFVMPRTGDGGYSDYYYRRNRGISWSPNSEYLVTQTGQTSPAWYMDVWQVSPSGLSLVSIDKENSGGHNGGVVFCWSPDSKYIACSPNVIWENENGNFLRLKRPEILFSSPPRMAYDVLVAGYFEYALNYASENAFTESVRPFMYAWSNDLGYILAAWEGTTGEASRAATYDGLPLRLSLYKTKTVNLYPVSPNYQYCEHSFNLSTATARNLVSFTSITIADIGTAAATLSEPGRVSAQMASGKYRCMTIHPGDPVASVYEIDESVSPPTFTYLTEITGRTTKGSLAVLSPCGRFVVQAHSLGQTSTDGYMRVYDLSTDPPTEVAALYDGYGDGTARHDYIAWSSDGNTLYYSVWFSGIHPRRAVWNGSTFVDAAFSWPNSGGTQGTPVVSPNGRYIWIKSTNTYIYDTVLETARNVPVLPHNFGSLIVRFTADSKYLIFLTSKSSGAPAGNIPELYIVEVTPTSLTVVAELDTFLPYQGRYILALVNLRFDAASNCYYMLLTRSGHASSRGRVFLLKFCPDSNELTESEVGGDRLGCVPYLVSGVTMRVDHFNTISALSVTGDYVYSIVRLTSTSGETKAYRMVYDYEEDPADRISATVKSVGGDINESLNIDTVYLSSSEVDYRLPPPSNLIEPSVSGASASLEWDWEAAP